MNKTENDAYREKMAAKLEQMEADIDHLEGQLKEAKADARLDLEKQMHKLRQHRENTKTRFEALRSASGQAWQEARDGMATAWDELTDALKNAREAFKAK